MEGRVIRTREFIVMLLVAVLMGTMLLPVFAQKEFLSRTAVCSNNMKAIGVGLELWRQNSGRYPVWDIPSGNIINPWPDILVMQNQYTEEWINNNQSNLRTMGLHPDYFIKTVEDDRIFYCPADHPHPHRINGERARAWGFWQSDVQDGYEYSYGLSQAVVNKKSEDDERNLLNNYHWDPSSQILSADGVWPWMQNLYAAYVNNPNANCFTGAWYNNTVGYFHGRGNQAVVVMRDGSIKYVNYGINGNGIDFSETFFYGRNETLNVFH